MCNPIYIDIVPHRIVRSRSVDIKRTVLLIQCLFIKFHTGIVATSAHVIKQSRTFLKGHLTVQVLYPVINISSPVFINVQPAILVQILKI